METEMQGLEWDISWDKEAGDVIFIDNPGDVQVYLTANDLQEMLETLLGEQA